MIEVTGGGGAAGASGGSSEAAVRTALEDYMARLPEPLNMVEVLPLLDLDPASPQSTMQTNAACHQDLCNSNMSHLTGSHTHADQQH